jgi:hypothetical protein
MDFVSRVEEEGVPRRRLLLFFSPPTIISTSSLLLLLPFPIIHIAAFFLSGITHIHPVPVHPLFRPNSLTSLLPFLMNVGVIEQREQAKSVEVREWHDTSSKGTRVKVQVAIVCI